MTVTNNLQRLRRRHIPLSLLALLATSTGFAQETAPAAADTADSEDSDLVVLSPFVVDASKDHGYYAENTLAGSRMRTKVSDLASSISVVTKQLMEDTASVDINDIFKYEVNTEGSSTYTVAAQGLRSEGIVDASAGAFVGSGTTYTNATANRVRGLGTPTRTTNYYSSISMLPMDAYNISSVEINRGPNSMLFGMGSPAGIVNQTTQAAMLTQDKTHLSFRFDDRGSMRGEFSFNRVLVDDKLAIYGAIVHDQRRFLRKPSYDNTRRMYGSVTAKPFSGTTIKANIESYENHNRRPNTVTPRDFVSTWIENGEPIYDCLSRTITNKDGDVLGVYVISSASPYAADVVAYIESMDDYDASLWNAAKTTYNGVSIYGDAALTNTASAMYVPGITWSNQARTVMQIANGELASWFQPLAGRTYVTAWGSSSTTSYSTSTILADDDSADVYNRYWSCSSGYYSGVVATSYWKYPGVTDKAVYDWEHINITWLNHGEEKNMTYNVELEQKLLDNLYLTAGWFRQNFEQTTWYTIGQQTQATIYVDTNKYLPDGSENPYCGEYYVEDYDPDQYTTNIDTNSYRVMLAYTPDFTKNKGWTKWLGHHQILGMWSREESMTQAIRARLEYVDSTSTDGMYRYMNNQNVAGYNYQSTSLRRQYYLKDLKNWDSTDYTGDITVYDYATGEFKTVTMTTTFNPYDASTTRNQRILNSLSAGMTNYLWEDRIISTFGVRRDENRTRATTTDGLTSADKWVDGYLQLDTLFNNWADWRKLSGTTKTAGMVFKPFSGWKGIERRANGGNLFWQFIRDFGLSYNKSDNFDAPTASYVDAFGTTLPKPVGNGEDYGFQFSLFDNKFFARVVWFSNTNENELTNPGTSISRLTGNIDTTLFRNYCRTIAKINMGLDPTTDEFWSESSYTTTLVESIEDATAALWGMSYDYYSSLGGTIYATRTAEAKGIEVQLNYNPTPGWTLRLTGGKQNTVYSDVLNEYDAWYAERSTVWDSASAASMLSSEYVDDYSTFTITSSGKVVDLTTFWSSYGYTSTVYAGESNGYETAALYFAGVVTPQVVLQKQLEGQSAPNQRRYRASLMSNYQFSTGKLKGFSFGGSERWEDKSVIGYLGKASGANGTLLDTADVTKPVYDDAKWYTDLWVAYSRKVFNNKVNMKIQLNVENVFEDGGLQVVSINLDGTPYAYRIVDSRLFKLTTSFDF